MTRYGTLLAAAAALFVAGWELVNDPDEQASVLATVTMTMGLILVGAWLAIEIHYLWQKGGNHGDDDD